MLFQPIPRQLVAQGHSLSFAVCFDQDRGRAIECMESLRAEGVMINHREVVLDPSRPSWRRPATFLLPFALHVIWRCSRNGRL